MRSPAEICIGVISDTHGLLRPAAKAALAPADLIVHAGDIGSPAVLDELRRLAPVRAVRGNTDFESWARPLPLTVTVEAAAIKLHVLHDLGRLALDPAAAGVAVVVSGHTHQAAERRRNGTLYFNPGSAGPRRSSQPPSVGLLRVRGGRIEAELIRLAG
jgi:putative phosphoesterase